jgi:hypothetical protein
MKQIAAIALSLVSFQCISVNENAGIKNRMLLDSNLEKKSRKETFLFHQEPLKLENKQYKEF